MKRYIFLVIILTIAGSIGALESDFVADHPAALAFDDADNTFASPRSGLQDAELELIFDEPRLLSGLELDATIPGDVVAWFEYRSQGHWIPILENSISNIDSTVSYRFHQREIVFDALRLKLSGETLDGVRLYDWHVETRESYREDRRVELKPLVPDSCLMMYLAPEYCLTDGLAGTGWIPVNWESRGYSGKAGEQHVETWNDFWRVVRNNELQGDNIAEFSVPQGISTGTITFFTEASGFGDDDYNAQLIIDIKSVEGNWETLETVNLRNLPEGWHDVALLGENDIEAIRFTYDSPVVVSGTKIGEIELFARPELAYNDEHPLIPRTRNGVEASDFFFKNIDFVESDYLLEILTSDTGMPAYTSLNGLTLDVEESSGDGFYRRTLLRLPASMILENVNVLSPEHSSRVFGAYLRRAEAPWIYAAVSDELGVLRPERPIHIRGMELFFESGQSPGQFRQIINGEEQLLIPAVQEESFILLIPDPASDGILFEGEVKHAQFLGSDLGRGLPSIQLLPSIGGITVGLTDIDGGNIFIDGKTAFLFDNYFWQNPFLSDFSGLSAEEKLDKAAALLQDQTDLPRWMRMALETGDAEYLPEDFTIIRVVDNDRGEKTFIIPLLQEDFGYGLWVNGPDGLWDTEEESIEITGNVLFYYSNLSINGESVGISGRSFSHEVELEVGYNTIEIKLTSVWGFVLAVQHIQVYRHPGPLEVSIQRPRNGEMIADSAAQVQGYVTGGSLESVTVENQPAKIDGTAFRSAPVPLEFEDNTINVEAVDFFGRSAQDSISVQRDLTPPEISLIEPVPGTWLASPSLSVTGYVRDEALRHVKVNGIPALISGNTFMVSLPVSDGDFTIEAVAEDWAGNTAVTVPVLVHIDTTPPEAFEIESNVEGWTNNTRPVLSFSTDDLGVGMSRYDVSIAGQPFVTQVSPYQLPFQEDGEHLVVIRAYDKLGNFRDAEILLRIDTLPPDAPGEYRVVPGRDSVEIRWNEDDEETTSYILSQIENDEFVPVTISRDAGWEAEEDNSGRLFFQFPIENLPEGQRVSYRLTPVDHAGNIGPSVEDSVLPGLTIAQYDTETGALVEYVGATLILPAIDDEEEAQTIVIINEVESPDMEEEATYPILGPIYDFSTIVFNEEGEAEAKTHTTFAKEYIGSITYDESEILEGFPEENLGVYFFNEEWGRWFKLDKSGVDTENNTIWFATDHFSSFSVQPTIVNDLSPQELRDVQFEPFDSKTVHDPLSVSTQGGTVSTSMTEFILPGRNGFDFELRRIYDTATARLDAAGLSLNLSVDLTLSEVVGDIWDILIGSGFTVLGQVEDAVKKYLKNNGDYAYSTGAGWRLNLPYIRGTNGGVVVRSPGGSYYDIHTMKRDWNEVNVDIFNIRNLYYQNHEGGEDFSLEILQTRFDVNLTSLAGGLTLEDLDDLNFDNIENGVGTVDKVLSALPSWRLLSATMTMADGSVYSFDAMGRLTSIVSPDGLSIITLDYENFELKSITDSMGRVIRFTYAEDTGFMPIKQIEKVWIEDDPQNRTVNYTYGAPGLGLVPFKLPLLETATDIGGRTYSYEYERHHLFSGDVSFKVNVLGIAGELLSSGTLGSVLSALGISAFNISAGIQNQFVFLMDKAQGPGIGINNIGYEIKDLTYFQLKADDFILGFIPTALTTSVGLQQRPLAKFHTYTDPLTGASFTRSYSFAFRYSFIGMNFLPTSSTMTDGLIREVHSFGSLRKKRWRFLSWSDAIQGGIVRPSALYNEDIPQERRVDTYDVSTGNRLFTKTTNYNNNNLRPSKIRVAYNSDQYTQTEYGYDNWGNIKWQRDIQTGGGTQYVTNIYTYFAMTDSSPSDSLVWPENPLGNPIGFKDNEDDENTQADESLVYRNRPLGRAVEYTIHTPEEAKTGYRFSYFAYDERGRSIANAERLSGNWSITRMEYDESNGELKRVTDPVGQVTDIEWSFAANPADPTLKTTIARDIVDADGQMQDITTIKAMDPQFYYPIWTQDGRGFVTSYTTDGLGRKTSITKPGADSPTTSVSYNDENLEITVTDPVGGEQTLNFAHDGQLIQMSVSNRYALDNAGNISAPVDTIHQWFYDSWGRMTGYINPNGQQSNFDYDSLGRLTKETFPIENGERSTRTYSYNYLNGQQIVIDEAGNKTLETYDMADRLLSVKSYQGQGKLLARSSSTYDAFGNTTAQIDAYDNRTLTEYDEKNNPVLVSMPEAEFFDGSRRFTGVPYQRTEYDLAGHPVARYVFSSRGEDAVLLTPDGLGRTIIEKQRLNIGGILSYAETRRYYDENGNEIKVLDPMGLETRTEYSARNQAERIIDALGNVVSFEYDAKDRQISITDQRGNSGLYNGDFTIEFKYDDLDRLYLGRLPALAPGEPKGEVRIIYDRRGNMLARIEPDGGRTDFTYTPRNWKQTETRSGTRLNNSALEYRTSYSYDSVGNLIAVTAPGGITTESEYDGLKRKVLDKLPDGSQLTYQYDMRSLLVRQTDGNDVPVRFEYDNLGRQKVVVDQEFGISRMEYDPAGNITRITDPEGHTLTSWFDERALVTREEKSRGSISTMSYDLAGRLDELTDANGTVIQYSYGPTNLINRIDYSGSDGSTQFQSFLYDEAGALQEANDNGIVTRYNYQSGSYMPNPFDLTRSVSETVNGDTKEMAYAYDVMQRVVEVTHSNSSQVEYLYNTLGQLERIPGYIDQPMEFADTGLLAGYTLANGAAASFDYDDKYRVKSISHNDAFGDEALAYSFRYDKADNLLQRNQEFFSYDRKGQLLSAALTGEAAATEYELDAIPQTGEARNDILGSRELVIPGENLTIDWGAGSLGIDLGYAYKVKRFTIGAAETALPLNKETLAIYSSVYNAEGAFKEEKFSLSEDSSEGSITIELEEAVFARFLKIHSHVNPLNAEGAAIEDEGVFTLDTDAVTVTALTGGRNEFYSYRKDGNREAVTIMADDFDTSPYSYYSGGDLIKTAGAYAFVYDANGNLRERGNVYTMSGEIPRIEKSGDYIKYEYDLLNRLVAVERLNDDGDLVNVARYRYNANGLRVLRTNKDGEETRYVFDLSGNVVEEHTGGELTRYVFRKNKHLARVSNEGTFFYGTDNLGSTVVITDETGATVWKGDVSPFGDRTTGDGTIEAQVKYTGKDMDEETGLYYFNARWYDPVLGRFTSEDPARDGANWFIYVNNNPLKWIDPSGLYDKYATSNWHELGQLDNYSGPRKMLNEGTTAMFAYLVEAGDTLGEIAEDVFGQATSENIDKLAAWNGIEDLNSIEVGQKIYAGPQDGRDNATLTQAFEDYEAALAKNNYALNGKIAPPFSSSIITSAEGLRDYPRSPNHGNAIDLIPKGGADSSIAAGGFGMIIGSGYHKVYGNYVIADYPGVGPIQYSHMIAPYSGKANGEIVQKGAILGKMGKTGSRNSGSHTDVKSLTPGGARIQSILDMQGVVPKAGDETLMKVTGFWENVLP